MDFRVESIRKLPRPEDGLRALAAHAPQAGAFAERLTERFRPTLTWLYVARRRIATTGVFLITGWLFFHVMFGANGMVVYRDKRSEYLGLQKEVDSLQKENDLYNHHIQSLQSDPKVIEKEAREQLHYARPGEVIYVSPAPAPPQTPASRAARK